MNEATTPNLSEDISRIIQEYIERDIDLLAWRTLSEKRQQRMRLELNIPPSVTPWAAHDMTFLMSGARGFALTPTGIYWRHHIMFPQKGLSKGHLSWDNFAQIPTEEIFIEDDLLLIGKGQSLPTAFRHLDEIMEMFRRISILLRTAQGLPVPKPPAQHIANDQEEHDGTATTSPLNAPVQCEYCGHTWPSWQPGCPKCGAPLPLPENRKRSQAQKIERITGRYVRHVPSGYLLLWEGLGSRKQQRARTALAIPKDDTPWIFYDNTIFSTAKSGFALTPKGIYWRNANPFLFTVSRKGFLPWPRAAVLWSTSAIQPWKKDGIYAVDLGGGIRLELTDSHDVLPITAMFQAIAAEVTKGGR